MAAETADRAAAEPAVTRYDDDCEVIRGSGNVFRDLSLPDPDIRQAQAILAAAIIKLLDARQWSTRKAEEMTGISHADFSRIRKVNISRFSIERLASILGTMGQEVEFSVQVRPREPHPAGPVMVTDPTNMTAPPEYGVPDDENPEWTEADFARARPFAEVFPEIAAAARKKGGRPQPQTRPIPTTAEAGDSAQEESADG